ncbi:hypothetical protein P175DRAFT_0109748 [Aspergillus ochraceoroseus IBT 24754]|uniref:Uncharacterized protein n=1 Tax=Aspergillus ochraceoroseus IBT 24754 TaxID=1392256 RepID=A0A2T5LL68_9EURO|nr:uncharacterized protein P175DRAFT_0109748 [Aspergillus ochraceoroseus IBT 24754]PTU17031.1 hypothetical protein P175DRAFT_0109748 [Aspergillus ochraceoroseus IBT 24754]
MWKLLASYLANDLKDGTDGICSATAQCGSANNQPYTKCRPGSQCDHSAANGAPCSIHKSSEGSFSSARTLADVTSSSTVVTIKLPPRAPSSELLVKTSANKSCINFQPLSTTPWLGLTDLPPSRFLA